MLSAFEVSLGTHQGRIDTPDGPVFVLGDSGSGQKYQLEVGDFVELEQQADLTDVDLVGVEGEILVLNSLPSDLTWEIALRIDGQTLASLRCGPGRTRSLRDLAAPCFRMQGPRLVTLRLSLERA